MTEWIDVDLSDVDDKYKQLRAARLEIPRRMGRTAAKEIGQIVVGEMREEAPERTGKLKRGLFYRVLMVARAGGGGFVIDVSSNQYYAKWVVEGRGWVYPVRAQVLHWVDESGEDVFAMYARPTEPNPFHERGWKRARPKIETRWTTTAEGIVKQIAK
jgi:hypothetical protein